MGLNSMRMNMSLIYLSWVVGEPEVVGKCEFESYLWVEIFMVSK